MASAEVKSEVVDYQHAGEACRGFVAHPEDTDEKYPAVIIIHNWLGESEYTRGRATMLAELGYVGFSADIFGTASRPKSAGEAPKFAQRFYEDRPLMRARAKAAFDEVAAMPFVDTRRIAVMGYCFGGTVAFELARFGADLVGAVSIHGGVSTPNPADGKNIKCKILALQGGDDPWVGPDQVQSFIKEMQDAKVNWELVQYGGAVHSYTDPDAGSDNSKGAAYNVQADKRSWIALQNFLTEVFA